MWALDAAAATAGLEDDDAAAAAAAEEEEEGTRAAVAVVGDAVCSDEEGEGESLKVPLLLPLRDLYWRIFQLCDLF